MTIHIPEPTPEQRATRTLGPVTVTVDLLEGRREPLPAMEWWESLGFLFVLDGASRACHEAALRKFMGWPETPEEKPTK